jgi:hypothetical protein
MQAAIKTTHGPMLKPEFRTRSIIGRRHFEFWFYIFADDRAIFFIVEMTLVLAPATFTAPSKFGL